MLCCVCVSRYVALVTNLSHFFSHLALFDCKVVSNNKPSLIAAAALCYTVLAISLYSRWPEFLEKATGWKYSEMKPVLTRMDELRQISIDQRNVKIQSMAKMHKNITKWLTRLNLDAVLNNTEST